MIDDLYMKNITIYKTKKRRGTIFVDPQISFGGQYTSSSYGVLSSVNKETLVKTKVERVNMLIATRAKFKRKPIYIYIYIM